MLGLGRGGGFDYANRDILERTIFKIRVSFLPSLIKTLYRIGGNLGGGHAW